jgi:hypothetical protein
VNSVCLKMQTAVDSVHGPWTTSGLGPWWTAVVHLGARWRARRSSASDRSGSMALDGDSQGGGVGHGALAPGLTGAREAVERQCDDDEGGGGGALGAGSLGCGERGRRGRGGVVSRGGAGAPFYRVGGGAGRPDGEGNRRG